MSNNVSRRQAELGFGSSDPSLRRFDRLRGCRLLSLEALRLVPLFVGNFLEARGFSFGRSLFVRAAFRA